MVSAIVVPQDLGCRDVVIRRRVVISLLEILMQGADATSVSRQLVAWPGIRSEAC
jgi:hypothetical protein